MFELFQTFLYQPFFNLLIGIYWLLNLVPNTPIDMGVTVIVFAILIRIILLPVSIAAHRSEKERKDIEEKIDKLQTQFKDDPVRMKSEAKHILRSNRRVLWAEMVSLGIQVSISLILWWIFSSGLDGRDVHLVYSFMPNIFPIPPEKMVFIGYSLNEPHWQMNVVQTILIFMVESIGMYLSPYSVKKGDVVRYQLFLPLLSFVIFAFLPAGKKLFVITTLAFSVVMMIVLAIRKKFHEIADRLQKKDEMAAQPQEEKVVVEVKG